MLKEIKLNDRETENKTEKNETFDVNFKGNRSKPHTLTHTHQTILYENSSIAIWLFICVCVLSM